MPNRIIRDGINHSERVDRLSLQAEVFYRRLLNVVDDYGRFDARPAILIAACYPLRAGKMKLEEVEAALRECAAGDQPLLVVYVVAGKPFLEVQGFRQQARSKSKYPALNSADAQQLLCNCVAGATQMSSNCALNSYSYSETETETKTKAYSESEPSAKDYSFPNGTAYPSQNKPETETTIPEAETGLGSIQGCTDTGKVSPIARRAESAPGKALPNWALDEHYAEFAELYRQAKPDLIDADLKQAYYAWTALDPEQRMTALANVGLKLRYGEWPAEQAKFVPKPAKWLQEDYQRPVVKPRAKGKPSVVEQWAAREGDE